MVMLQLHQLTAKLYKELTKHTCGHGIQRQNSRPRGGRGNSPPEAAAATAQGKVGFRASSCVRSRMEAASTARRSRWLCACSVGFSPLANNGFGPRVQTISTSKPNQTVCGSHSHQTRAYSLVIKTGCTPNH
jgi:hypothetical protein